MTTISTFRFHIELIDGLYIKGFSGRIVHGAFLQFIRDFDEELSEYLHEQQRQRMYSTTCMNFRSIGNQRIAYFDINTKNQYLIDTLIRTVIADTPQEIFIVDRFCPIFKIEYKKTVIPDPQPLPVGTTIRLRFNTTTVFSSNRREAKTDPYPHLDIIWKQLISNYSRLIDNISVEETAYLIQYLINQIATPHFNLRSNHETLGYKIKVTGFVGTILFLIEDSTNLELLKPILTLAKTWGIGGKTTMGFGQINVKIKEPKKLKKQDEIEIPQVNKSTV